MSHHHHNSHGNSVEHDASHYIAPRFDGTADDHDHDGWHHHHDQHGCTIHHDRNNDVTHYERDGADHQHRYDILSIRDGHFFEPADHTHLDNPSRDVT